MSDFAQRFFNELRDKLPGIDTTPKAELQATLQAALRKLDLVTREEFDAQAAVLMRTRERLEALEKTVEKLEADATNHNA